MAYPLQAARDLRAQELDAAQAALAEAIAAEVAAEQLRAQTEEALKAHRDGTRAAKEVEVRLEVRSVSDLQQGQAYLKAREASDLQLQAELTTASEALTACRAQGEAARSALADARAQKEAVEKHFTRWKQEQRKAADKRAEDEADDLTSARHGRK